MYRKVFFYLLILATFSLWSFSWGLKAQTSTTGALVGTVTDAHGAVVVAANVDLTSEDTGVVRRTTTNASGAYTFPELTPGRYAVAITASGFRTEIVRVTVEVAKSVSIDVTLQLGELSQKVEVIAGVGVELQTTDAAVGDVVGSDQLERLPTVQRRASELVYLQVTTTPLTGSGENFVHSNGSVAGARTDQNTATLDGVLVSDLNLGGEIGGGISNIQLPVEAIEEFRGTVSNPNENLSRSSGGQFSITTRRGTNDWHGATYWFHQNDELNANDWNSNFLHQPRTELKDNRFGARLGGPIRKDKTFFFVFYEGRRFPHKDEATRVGISDSLRQGVLRFRDASGNVVSYDLATSKLCGPSGNLACDPRGLGLSPVIKQYFSFYPEGNFTSGGDGLNTVGITGPVDTSLRDDTAVFRLDHILTKKWRFQGSYLYQQHRENDTTQIDFNPSVTHGQLLKSTSGLPANPRFLSAGVTGELTPNLIYDFRLGWNKQQFTLSRALPTVLVPGAGTAMQLADLNSFFSFLDNPGDPLGSRARPIFNSTTIWQYNNSLSWIKGKHIFRGGVNYGRYDYTLSRLDKGGFLSIPVAQITADITRRLPPENRPPICSGAVTTNCLQPGDVLAWDALYGSVLGIWDDTQMLIRRDAAGNAIAPGPVTNEDRWHHLELTAGDTWRIKPSLTLNLGLNVTEENPIVEAKGLQSYVVDANTGALIHPFEMLSKKAAAANAGHVFNEQIEFVPRSMLGNRSPYPRILDASPHVSAAWNPSFGSGPLGFLFGDRKSVLRGGYSLMYDSSLMATLASSGLFGNPLLGNNVSITAPTCEFAGTPGPGCVAGVSPFRVGVDGPASAPTGGPIAIPFIPSARTITNFSYGLPDGSAIDPNFTLGHTHGANLTLQRELKSNVLLELGWIGHWGRNLPTDVNVNAPPVFLRDLSGLSKQTFAQAFDALAAQLRSGVAPSAVTSQPWFENSVGSGSTVSLAANHQTDIIVGDLVSVLSGDQNSIDGMLLAQGKPTISNQQYNSFAYHTNGSYSNYNALFTSIHIRSWHGLTSTFNWTWSHCLDTAGANEDFVGGILTNPYNVNFDYGACFSDIRHNVQSYGTYDLPGRKPGRGWNKFASGWYTSYIFAASTGTPQLVVESFDAYGAPIFGLDMESVPASGPVPSTSSVHRGVTGSNGIGSAGDPANGGTGLNLFSNPEAVFNNLRPFELSKDTRTGRGLIRGLGFWNLDFSVGKRTKITEKLSTRFSFDFFNVFNHPDFASPGLLFLQDRANFGVISSTITPTPILGDINVGPRRVQFGLRFDF